MVATTMMTRISGLHLLACVAAAMAAAPAMAEDVADATVVRLSPAAAERAIESGAASAATDDGYAMIDDGPVR